MITCGPEHKVSCVIPLLLLSTLMSACCILGSVLAMGWVKLP